MKLFSFLVLSVGVALSAVGCRATPSSHGNPLADRAREAAKRAGAASHASTMPVIPATLDAYIARPEPAYKWEVTARPEGKSGGPYELTLTSQTWHDITWTHHVQVFRPEKIEFPGAALLSVSFGHGTPMETFFGQVVANETGAVFVNVFDVPNQPLFDAHEDGLIALTFDKALQTGDLTWPLLLPMTKSAVQAMNAIGEFSKQEWGAPITKFAITGASKRGWTTYLVGAAEAKAHPGRVIGLAPFVYDNLSIQAQLRHQYATWGEFSPKIVDYTRRDLPEKMLSSEGTKLVEIVDPYTYRARLTMPKLLVCASNDEYWNLDGFDFYGKDLPGETVRYEAPNVGHMMSGQEARSAGTLNQWFRRIAAGQKVPTVALTRKGSEVSIITQGIAVPPLPKFKFWIAHSASRDFRHSQWSSIQPVGARSDGKQTRLILSPAPADQPYTAIFGEVEIPGDPLPLVLSTPVQIFGPDDKTQGDRAQGDTTRTATNPPTAAP